MLKKTRKYVIRFWIVILAIFGISLLLHPEMLDPKHLASAMQELGIWGLILYGTFFLFRGLLLVPSTPLILVGMILFPGLPHTVFLISMTGILISAYIIYQFSDILGLDDYFAKNVKNESIKKAIEKYGFYAVTFWSFFLVLPTDLICYIAGAVRMNIYKFLLAVALWEGFVIGIFIYGGGHVLDFLRGFFA